jgi:hypothetical protein
MSDASPLLLAAVSALLLTVLFLQLRYWWRLRIHIPQLPPSLAVVTGAARESKHQVHFVSRHELAECDLVCPSCGCMVASRGDFSRVERTEIDGHANEVLRCPGFVGDPADRRPCGLILAASPDTEHGDHLRDDGTVDAQGETEPPEFYLFKRVDPARVLREKYGLDVSADGDGMSVPGAPEAVGTDKIAGWVPPGVQTLLDPPSTPANKDTP